MSLRKIINCGIKLGFIFILINVHAKAQEKTFTPSQVRKDMSILYKKLVRFHPQPFTYIDAETHRERYLKAYKDIDGNMTLQQVYDHIAPIITDVKDLHTSTGMPKKWAKNQKKILPLFFRKYEDQYYLSYNCSKDTTLFRGLQVSSIEGEAIGELVEKAKRYYATDNDNEVSKLYYAVSRLPNILNRLMPIKDSMLVSFKNVEKDSVFSKYVYSEENKQVSKVFKVRYPKLIRKNFDYQVLDSLHRIATLDITTFSEKGKLLNFNQRKFKKKLQAKMQQVAEDSVQTLILDMRGNGGGAIVNIPRVVGYFAKEKYKMMDSMAVKKKAFLAVFPPYQLLAPVIGKLYFSKTRGDYFVDFGGKKPKNKPTKKNHFDGKLYVLGDGGSYSATIYTTSLLQELELATYVGDRAGGTRWGSFAGKWHTGALPNTKIKYRIPYYKIAHYLPKTGKKSLFIEPDVQLNHTWEDFLKFEDSYLKQTVELIKNNVK